MMSQGRAIESCFKIRCIDRGWSDVQTVKTLVVLNVAGGESVSDLHILAG